MFIHTHIPSKQKMKCKIQKFKDVKFIYFKYKLSLWLKMSHISDCVTHVYSLAIFLDQQVNSQDGLVVSLFIRILFRLLLKSFSRLISYAHCSLKNLLQSDLLSQWYVLHPYGFHIIITMAKMFNCSCCLEGT